VQSMVSQRAACGPAVLVDGLAATQRLATADGWVEAGDLLVGDPVLTFEGGEMPVARVFRSAQAARVPQPFWPIWLPVGAMENDEPAELLPAQMVMLESDLAEELYGEPFVLIPASALVGWNGIERRAPEAVEIVHVQFETPQLVFAGRSLLLSCGGTGAMAANLFQATGLMALNAVEARQLVAGLIREDERGRVMPAYAALAGEYRL
jgi:Hint domain